MLIINGARIPAKNIRIFVGLFKPVIQNIEKIGKYLVFHEDNFLGLGEIDNTYWIQPLKVLSERRNI